jgi:hypothetical protein
MKLIQLITIWAFAVILSVVYLVLTILCWYGNV